METPTLTPMQQLAEKLKEQQSHAKLWAAGSDYHSGRLFAYTKSLELLTEHLPKEQEAIEQGYKAGWDKGYKHISMPAEQYFNQTYKDNEDTRSL